MWTNYLLFWDDYNDPLKVTFDGDNKRIYVNEQYSIIDVKADLYSASKRWIRRRQNAKYLPPFRTVGGDPVGSGLYAGDIYFLINDWQIVVNHTIKATGIIYHDNPSLEPWIIMPGGGVTNIVSNLAIAYNAGAGVGTVEEVQQAVWAATQATTLQTDVTTIKAQTDTVEAATATIIGHVDSLESSMTTVIGHVDSLESSMSAIQTDVNDLPANTATAVWTKPIEATFTAEDILKIAAAVLAGKVSGAGTGSEVFTGLDGTTIRVISNNDAQGNRTSLTLNGS